MQTNKLIKLPKFKYYLEINWGKKTPKLKLCSLFCSEISKFWSDIGIEYSAILQWHLPDLTITEAFLPPPWSLSSWTLWQRDFNWSAWGHELTSSATQSLPSCFKTQGRGPSASLAPAKAGSAQSDYPEYFSMSAPGLSFCFKLQANTCHTIGCFNIQTGLEAHREKVGWNSKKSNLTVPEKRLSFWGS